MCIRDRVYTSGDLAPYVNWGASGYRLPTEAEWEKAARGGLSGLRFPWGNTISENQANYYGDTNDLGYDLGPNGYNSIGSIGGTSPATSPVGSFVANGYGLYDMAGNVAEWCGDWYDATPYAGGSDPRGPASGSNRVLRGGVWADVASDERCAYRNGGDPNFASYNYGFQMCIRDSFMGLRLRSNKARRPCARKPSGGGSFVFARRWLGRHSPLWGCTFLAALAKAKIPRRSTCLLYTSRCV